MAADEYKMIASNTNELKEYKGNPADLLQISLNGLNKLGGFQLLKGLIKGVENMDPRRKAAKNIFLSDSAFSESRQKLANEIRLWISLLEKDCKSPIEIIDLCKEECEKAEQNLSENLYNIREEIKKIEITYRTLDSFFANAGQGKVDCLRLMNVCKDDLKVYDSDDTKKVTNELEQYYDQLSLKKSYSLLVMPGYLAGDEMYEEDDNRIGDIIRRWASIAAKNKVLFITDFKDSEDLEMLNTQLDNANLQGKDACLANAIMTCNYILGRKKSKLAGETDDLYLPPSGALAGKMSNTDDVVIAQGVAGKKYGTLNNVLGAKLDLRKSEIASLIDQGVIPMVEVDGRTMAFSNCSLYNGATMGLQEYPIVRVFDWIAKVFQHFFNEKANEIWDADVKKELNQAVHDFLSDYKGPGKLIENYNLKTISQDPKTKNIDIKVEIKPFFAAKNFIIELTGQNCSEAGANWDQNIQEK